MPIAIPTLAVTNTSRPSTLERRLQRRDDPLGGVDGRRRARDLFDQDRELVASHPRDGVAGRERLAEANPDAAQQRVTGGVTQRVVDALEVVQVEKEDGDLRPSLLAAQDERVLDAVREQRAVREPGERVVEGLVAELLLRLAPSRDVEEVALEDELASVRDDARLVLHPQVATVPRAKAVLDEERLARRVRAVMCGENALAILRVQQLHEEVVVLDPLDGRSSRAWARSAGSYRRSS